MAQLDWKAEYAYTTGMQAFIYGFPYIYNAQLRHDWVTSKRDPDVVPYAAVDHFWHAARLIDASYRDGGCPNNDTLYSLAWLDLSEEPVILSHPDMGDRYFTFELMGFTSDTYDYVGQRTTGKDAGHFAISGPGWQGKLPLRQQFLSGDWATLVNGWRYPPPNMGRFGDDFLQRAADQSMAGITANDPAESVYLVNFTDAEGSTLVPDGRYELHFSAGSLPPVDAFWSLAVYTTQDMNLIPNAADRFSVGDRTPDLRWDHDGGLTIHLQPEPPSGQGKPNWLPTSATDPWFVILRMYRPHPEVIAATWKCPGITKVG